ncbi:unnamed protein product, partial [Amoebophrya sp. A25]
NNGAGYNADPGSGARVSEPSAEVEKLKREQEAMQMQIQIQKQAIELEKLRLAAEKQKLEAEALKERRVRNLRNNVVHLDGGEGKDGNQRGGHADGAHIGKSSSGVNKKRLRRRETPTTPPPAGSQSTPSAYGEDENRDNLAGALAGTYSKGYMDLSTPSQDAEDQDMGMEDNEEQDDRKGCPTVGGQSEAVSGTNKLLNFDADEDEENAFSDDPALDAAKLNKKNYLLSDCWPTASASSKPNTIQQATSTSTSSKNNKQAASSSSSSRNNNSNSTTSSATASSRNNRNKKQMDDLLNNASRGPEAKE